jgi:hypothetical protein
MISGFVRNVHEICALLRYYAVSNGNPLPTFRDNVSVPSSRVKKSKKIGPIGCPETSLKGYHSTVRNNPEESRSYNSGYFNSYIFGKQMGRQKDSRPNCSGHSLRIFLHISLKNKYKTRLL